MAGRSGCVLVSDPRTGEITAAWNLERGLHDAYPPGSTAKIVESAAALESGVISPEEQVVCLRVPPILGEPFRCVHPPSRSAFTLPHALANSCNYFFAALSLKLSSDVLAHWYSVLGFGQATDASAIPAGRVSFGADARSKALAALGEGDVLATHGSTAAGIFSVCEPRRVPAVVERARPRPEQRCQAMHSTATVDHHDCGRRSRRVR